MGRNNTSGCFVLHFSNYDWAWTYFSNACGWCSCQLYVHVLSHFFPIEFLVLWLFGFKGSYKWGILALCCGIYCQHVPQYITSPLTLFMVFLVMQDCWIFMWNVWLLLHLELESHLESLSITKVKEEFICFLQVCKLLHLLHLKT